MANTYHQIYLQAVFAVRYREAVIEKSWRSQLLEAIGNLINEANPIAIGCKTTIVNGVEDHIHCLVGLRPVVSVSDLMKTVKAKSSKYINHHSLTPARFEWQEACLPVGRVMVFFHTVKKRWMLFISIFNIRRSILEFKHFVKSTWNY